MIKRLLVCFSFALCPMLWGNGDVVIEQRANISANAKETLSLEEGAKDFSRSDIAKMMNIKDKFDYSYESHTDIAYDLYGYNKHINRRLSKEEQAKYYADPLAYMESLAQSDWQRAFEMSMYYQGWKPNTIFFRFDFLMLNNDFNFIPSTDDMRFKTRKTLDKEKALYWAKIACELRSQIEEISVTENAGTIQKGNTKYDFTTRYNTEDSLEFLKYNLIYRLDEADVENKDEEIKALLSRNHKSFYEKYATIRYDLSDNNKFFFASNSFRYWRHFYCGFVYPKNKDFAILSIISNKDKYNFAKKSISLFKIVSGLYDKEEYNETFFSFYKREAILKKINASDEERTVFSGRDNYISRLNRYAIEDLSLENFEYQEEFTIKSDIYDKAKAVIELEKLFNDPRNVRGYNDINEFMDFAARRGISEEFFKELMQIIRKRYMKELCDYKEEVAQEIFSGRLPIPYDYR